MIRIGKIIHVLGLIVFPALAVTTSFADDPSPDPRILLTGVERDRLSLKSGKLGLDVIVNSPKRPHLAATRMKLVIEFEGDKRRFHTDQRVLMTPWLRSDPIIVPTKEEQLVELMGSREAIVRQGIGHWLDVHACTIYDGQQLMGYRKSRATFVKDLKQGAALSGFDPRVIGLSYTFRPSETVHEKFSPLPNESVTLIGREDIGGVPAWHVLIGGVGDGRNLERHLWIDPLPGHRVYKSSFQSRFGSSQVVSEYGLPGIGERLPLRVTVRHYDPAGALEQELIVERKHAEFDVPIDPGAFTFTGLELPVGEPVTDDRVKRIIGYWDGQGLSEKPVPRAPVTQEQSRPPQPSLTILLEVARKARAGGVGLDALAEITRSAPSGPEAGEAVKLLTEFHAAAKGVGEIGLRLIESQPEGTEQLFRSVLVKNPNREDQGQACFGLAKILKNRSERLGRGEAGNAAATESERLFERVISSYGDVRHRLEVFLRLGERLGEIARTDLDEMRTSGVGKVAPDINGEDLDGKPLSLHTYRGKVVVIVFWATSCAPCLRMIPHERELVARMKSKPFALLGVSGDDDRRQAKVTAEAQAMTWPSWWHGGSGSSIATGWGVRGWPRVFVLDSKGVIRFKDLDDQALDKAVESLVEEAGHR